MKQADAMPLAEGPRSVRQSSNSSSVRMALRKAGSSNRAHFGGSMSKQVLAVAEGSLQELITEARKLAVVMRMLTADELSEVEDMVRVVSLDVVGMEMIERVCDMLVDNDSSPEEETVSLELLWLERLDSGANEDVPPLVLDASWVAELKVTLIELETLGVARNVEERLDEVVVASRSTLAASDEAKGASTENDETVGFVCDSWIELDNDDSNIRIGDEVGKAWSASAAASSLKADVELRPPCIDVDDASEVVADEINSSSISELDADMSGVNDDSVSGAYWTGSSTAV